MSACGQRGACVERSAIGRLADGSEVQGCTLRNANGMRVRFIERGGSILAIDVPDRDGHFRDVALGFDTLDEYQRNSTYFGCLIGRYAGRIAGGRFVLDGRAYQVAINEPPNHLHGGLTGFHMVEWRVQPFVRDEMAGADLHHVSAAGHAGFPGELDVHVRYTLTPANELCFDFRATSSEPTPVNFTQHSYLNLAGHDAGPVLNHELLLNARQYVPVDQTLIPTGELSAVAGTPFDFTRPTPIGAHIGDDHEQLRRGGGYDHTFVIDGADGIQVRHAARLHEPGAGRTLDVFTTEPGIQLYTGNQLDGVAGKGGARYVRHAGLALETQHFSDSPNQPGFPGTILRPGVEFRSRTIFRFGTV